MKITSLDLITSKENIRIKAARAVRDGRDKEQIFAEGVRLVKELVRSELAVSTVFISEDQPFAEYEDLSSLIKLENVNAFRLSHAAFNSIKDTNHSQGIIALAKRPEVGSLADIHGGKGPYIYLNRVNNPSNLGAVVRSAEAAGATAVITSPESADAFSPKALRASMGSAFRMPILSDVEIIDFVNFSKEARIRTVAIDPMARPDYSQFDWTTPAAMIFGSEAHGLEDRELATFDVAVRIPMNRQVESLNLAVSAGILLFEAKRQREMVKL